MKKTTDITLVKMEKSSSNEEEIFAATFEAADAWGSLTAIIETYGNTDIERALCAREKLTLLLLNTMEDLTHWEPAVPVVESRSKR